MPVALFGLTLAITVASVVLGLGYEPTYDTVLYALLGVTFGAVGLLVARRHPRNRMGWLFLGLALLNVVADLVQAVQLRAGVQPDEDLVTNWGVLLVHIGWALLFLLFPDGRLPSRRWRWWAPVAALGLALCIAGRVLEDDALWAIGLVFYVPAFAGPVVAPILRLRRSHGEERLQLKWFTYAATLAVIVLTAALALWFVTPVIRVLAALVEIALPIAAGIAILRHRLYDIDVVINRTLVYAALTVLLAAVYALTALAAGTIAGGDSPLVTAAATLLAAVAFRPLRAHTQDAVDRRFSRARYAARRRIAGFLEDLRAGRVEADQVTGLLREVLDDPVLDVRFLGPDDEAAAGTTLMSRAGVPLAEFRHSVSRERLDEAVEAAGLALEIARHVEEVRASRARLAAAADAERRRIERDLHDGAQQRLVSIGLALRHAQHELDGAPPSETLEEAIDEIMVAIAELRELARGVRPPALDAGIDAALRDLAGRAPLAVAVTATRERFPDGVESTAYFVASEGLTNAIKHARATKVALSAQRSNGDLVVRVADDGAGGATARSGTGLAGLRDRVTAHGGALRIESPPGAGTTLTVILPCE